MLSILKRARQIGNFAVRFHDSPSEIETEWRALEARGVGSVFQSYAWCATWCRIAAGPSGDTPLIVVGRTMCGRIAFILPFALRQAWSGTQLCWLAQNCSAHNMGLYERGASSSLDGETVRAIIDAARSVRPDLTCVNLHGQPEFWDDLRNPFAALASAPAGQSLYLLRGDEGFDALYRTNVARRHRRKIRNSEAYFLAEGQLQSGPDQTAAEKLAAFEAFVVQKSRQLANSGFTNLYDRPEIVSFFRALIRDPDIGPRIHVSAAWADDGLAACAIGVRHHDYYFIVMLSRTLGPMAEKSPGQVVVKRALAHQSQMGARVFDFGAGHSGLKANWHCERHQRFETALALTAKGLPNAGYLRARYAAETAVRSQPHLFALAKRAVDGWRSLRAAATIQSRRRPDAPQGGESQNMAAKTRSGGA